MKIPNKYVSSSKKSDQHLQKIKFVLMWVCTLAYTSTYNSTYASVHASGHASSGSLGKAPTAKTSQPLPGYQAAFLTSQIVQNQTAISNKKIQILNLKKDLQQITVDLSTAPLQPAKKALLQSRFKILNQQLANQEQQLATLISNQKKMASLQSSLTKSNETEKTRNNKKGTL